MKIFFLIVCLILSWTVPVFAVSGLVIETTGKLILTRPDGTKQEALLGEEFDDGTTFSSLSGAALLLFVDGTLLPLSSHQKFKVGQSSSPMTRGKILFGGIQNGIEAAFSLGKMEPAGARAPLDRHPPAGGIEGVYPVYGSLRLPSSIRFQWKGKKIFGQTPALIFFEEGMPEQKTFFFVTPEDKNILLTGKELRLQKGREYHWYLGKVKNNKPDIVDRVIAQSRVFTFKILSDKEEVNLAKDLAKLAAIPTKTTDGANFLKAQIFYNYQMYHDMASVLDSLYKKYQTPGIRKMLFLGYVKLGRYKEARKFEIK